MNRRDFLAGAAAVPFSTFATNASLHPNRLTLPGLTWSVLACVSRATCGFAYFNGCVSDEQAWKLAQAINTNWRELPAWYEFCLGIDEDHDASQWLLGEGWEQRVRTADAFFRSGGFEVVLQSGSVLLERSAA